jgi:hypothetical protein
MYNLSMQAPLFDLGVSEHYRTDNPLKRCMTSVTVRRGDPPQEGLGRMHGRKRLLKGLAGERGALCLAY